MGNSSHMRLSVWGFGLACGLTWGLGLALLTCLSLYFGIGTPMIKLMGSFYLGLTNTIAGIFSGLIWGLLDGFICGAFIAFFYNLCVKHCCCCKTK